MSRNRVSSLTMTALSVLRKCLSNSLMTSKLVTWASSLLTLFMCVQLFLPIQRLDPARPLVSNYGSSTFRLGRDDAHVVQVLHTNAGFLGESGLVGHADFCINGGRLQPGCKGHKMRIARCSHFMSSCYFAASIRRRLRMVGVPCDTTCPKEGRWGIRSLHRAVRIGDEVPDSTRGMYCVRVNHEENCPFD